jgi:type III secretion system YscQ/HrcQ family protein
LIEFFLLALWERINRDLAWDFRIGLGQRGRIPPELRRQRGVAITSNLRLRRETRTVRLFVPFQVIEAMRYTFPGSRPQFSPELVGWRCPLTVGTAVLTPAEIRSVERFDVLLVERRAALWLPGGFRAGWTCRIAEGNSFDFRVDKYFETEQIVAEDESRAPQADETPGSGAVFDAGKLPVQLHVIVGEKSLTLSELQALREGSIVQLDRGTDATVDLAVNGKIVGRGELVEYEGALGVKILGWRQV